MSMNDTPLGNRIHIGFFGNRNAGKSSLVNAITNQSLSVVSDIAGTTTDPVYKSMELLPLGPVVIIDTPGFDDEGRLGEMRIEKTRSVLEKTDIAVLVVDIAKGISDDDCQLLDMFRERNIKYIIAYNKCDTKQDEKCAVRFDIDAPQLFVSAACGRNIEELKEAIGRLLPDTLSENKLVSDLIAAGDFVVLVVPIDKAAPKGRLILPQQQVIRDVLEAGATAVVVRDTELADTLKRLGGQVKLVITDSQVFSDVMKIVPAKIKLTSFSILMARWKGQLAGAVKGAAVLDDIHDGDKILISEGCTHHRQCDDIGTVKLPNWINRYTGKKIDYEFTSGGGFPKDLSDYRLVIHCGGCMLNEREMMYRQGLAGKQGVPMTNYGIAIAHMNGILNRSIEVFQYPEEK
ncbi:MAG: [FeFe] hydrogenase H-cluster maturation GTPase HydF [Coprococcus sp.]|nr:[FeFe] hydrogenase H-cluster maturation GTPase HydF [Coprococcus sp.]